MFGVCQLIPEHSAGALSSIESQPVHTSQSRQSDRLSLVAPPAAADSGIEHVLALTDTMQLSASTTYTELCVPMAPGGP